MKASLILLILFLVISLHLAEASTLFEGVKKASAIKSNIVKIVLLTGAAFLLLGSILYIRIKVKERSESNVQKIKVLIIAGLKQGQKPLAITRRLTQIYPSHEVREALHQTLRELAEKE